MSKFRGKAVIAQSGGPTRVINQTLVGAVEEAAKHTDQIIEFAGSLHGPEGIINGDYVDLFSQSVRTLEEVANTPSSALFSSRQKIGKEIDPEQFFEALVKGDFRFFFYIGGDDSALNAMIVNQIAVGRKYELRVFHLPKTIDNNLEVNDHTPGYGSAGRYVAEIFMGVDQDNRALNGAMVGVVMGRDAGFLAAASVLARQNKGDGPHLIYLPEVPFSTKKFLADVDRVYSRHGRAVIAVSEGIRDSKGKLVATTGEKDAYGHKQLSGTGILGDYLAGLIKDKLKIKRVRADTYGYPQRSFPETVSEQDAIEAREVGRAGIRFALPGNIDGSVAIQREAGQDYGFYLELTSLESVAGKNRTMPRAYIARNGHDVTPAFIAYAAPLVGELPVIGMLDMSKKAK